MSNGLFDFEKEVLEDASITAVLARKFANTLHAKGHNTKVNISNWVEELKKLEGNYGINEVQWLVESHCEAIANSKKHLKVYSAKSLVRRFQELRKFYGIAGTISLSKEQELILAKIHLECQNWTPEHTAKLPAIVKLSHENYSKAWLKIKSLDDMLPKMINSIQEDQWKGKISSANANTLLQWYKLSREEFEISNPKTFIFKWIQRIKNYLNGFPDWEGNLLKFVWEIDQEDFKKAMNASIKRKTCSTKVHWDMFVSEFLR